MVKSGAVTWDEINVNYRTFSLNFGVRAGTQEDYDWIEEQMWENEDDFRTFATALSWMTDTTASIPVIERVRLILIINLITLIYTAIQRKRS